MAGKAAFSQASTIVETIVDRLARQASQPSGWEFPASSGMTAPPWQLITKITFKVDNNFRLVYGLAGRRP